MTEGSGQEGVKREGRIRKNKKKKVKNTTKTTRDHHTRAAKSRWFVRRENRGPQKSERVEQQDTKVEMELERKDDGRHEQDKRGRLTFELD